MTDRIQIIPELAEVLGIALTSHKYCKRETIDCESPYKWEKNACNICPYFKTEERLLTYKQLWELEKLVFKIKSKVIHLQAEGDNSYVYEDLQYYPTEEKYIGASSTTREQALQMLIVKLIKEDVLSVDAVRKVVCGE